tara:strand:+ start:316 stop:462 length:147 start_codon:yes stop_codon:yes gene_type:complete
MNPKNIKKIIEKSISSNLKQDTNNKDKSKSSKEIDDKHKKIYNKDKKN